MRAAFLPVLLVLASIGTAAERPKTQSNNGLNMDYGPAISNSLTYRQKQEASAPRFPDTTERVLILDLPGDAALCYDSIRHSVSGYWEAEGRPVDTTDTHNTSYKGKTCFRPVGKVLYKDVDQPGWVDTGLNPLPREEIRFRGHHINQGRVLLNYKAQNHPV